MTDRSQLPPPLTLRLPATLRAGCHRTRGSAAPPRPHPTPPGRAQPRGAHVSGRAPRPRPFKHPHPAGSPHPDGSRRGTKRAAHSQFPPRARARRAARGPCGPAPAPGAPRPAAGERCGRGRCGRSRRARGVPAAASARRPAARRWVRCSRGAAAVQRFMRRRRRRRADPAPCGRRRLSGEGRGAPAGGGRPSAQRCSPPCPPHGRRSWRGRPPPPRSARPARPAGERGRRRAAGTPRGGQRRGLPRRMPGGGAPLLGAS